jgi:hypothetical protein
MVANIKITVFWVLGCDMGDHCVLEETAASLFRIKEWK